MATAKALNRFALAQGALWVTSLARRIRPIHVLAVGLPALAGVVWARRKATALSEARTDALFREDEVGQWDIKPGETRLADGARDLVTEASMESFPGSDPPSIGQTS